MPKRLIDYDSLWNSTRLSRCTPKSRVEYLWIYGLADAGGSFEVTNLRAIWGRVSVIRPDLTLKRLKNCLEQFEKNGLLFCWAEKGKKFGHWIGSTKPGRLPSPSTKARYYLVCPYPPTEQIEKYESRFDRDFTHALSHAQDLEVDLDLEGIGIGRGKGIGFVAPAAHSTAAKPAAAPRVSFSNHEIQVKGEPLLIGKIKLPSVTVTCPKCSGSFDSMAYTTHRCFAERQ
jgi:hypothetical protein